MARTEGTGLSAYLARIGCHGQPGPDLESLHALTRAHTQSIPFETIDVLLRRPIELQPRAVFDKLVRARRGGYCFEHNGLFMAMLAAIGFRVRPLRAAVRLGQPDRSMPLGHTHLVLAVELAGEQWITDVGVGSSSLTAALRWQDGTIQTTPHDRRRLQRDGPRWFHQIEREGAWVDVYEFADVPMPLPDQRIASWYTSSHPDSSFQRELIVARALPDGRRAALRGRQLLLRDSHGQAEPEHLRSASELDHALRETFDLHLPGADVERLFVRAAVD